MRLKLLAVGTRVPDWVRVGFEEYARRLPRDNRLELVEIAAADRRSGKPVDALMEEEGQRLLAAVGRDDLVVALEVRGKALSTEQLADRMRDWRMDGRDLCLLVGGPDGLSPACRQRAEMLWSLSPLTLPHALVRIVVAEQCYRAWTMLSGHPYHR